MADTGEEAVPRGKETEVKRPLSILLVEDEKPIAFLIKTVLKDHNVTSFEKAEEALEELRKAKLGGRSFDWVITDWGLAGKMDGFDLAGNIKSGDFGRPFVTMISGKASIIQRDNSPDQLREKSIHQLMDKPFNIKELSDSAETVRKFQKQSQIPQS